MSVHLTEQVKTFLEAEGFIVSERRELVVGTRRTYGEEVDRIFVWVPNIGEAGSFRSREADFLERFRRVSEDTPTATQFMVVPSFEGLSREFVMGAPRWYRVKIRTPVQFFDTDFKWETSAAAPFAAKELKEKGQHLRSSRVRQPYKTRAGQKGHDLLPYLRDILTEQINHRKPVHVVVGPAGIGKSVLFQCLFADLHNRFLEYKRSGSGHCARPLALLPEHLHLPRTPNKVEPLLLAYLQTDFARPLTQPVFEWMLLNGFGLWMLDGLDEVIAQDPDFVEYLLDLMTRPGFDSHPIVLMCVRDSLLATNDLFREFCEDYSPSVEVYSLEPWREEQKREFARIELGASDASRFMSVLRDNKSADDLASNPFYCSLLVEEFKQAPERITSEISEISLLERSLDSLIQRDYSKGFIDEDLVSPEDIKDFLEAVASLDLEGGFRGVPVPEVREWATMILPPDLPVEDQERLSQRMVNLAIFAHAGPSHVRFSQEILEQYLLGSRLQKLLSSDRPAALFSELGHRLLPPDWVTLKMLSSYVAEEGSRFELLKRLIIESLSFQGSQEVAFKNLLQTAALCVPNPSALRDIPFERRDLSGLVFRSLELDGVSFAGCDLTDTRFIKCSLKGANLIDAILRNTTFIAIPHDGLREAKVGDLSKFYSVRVGETKTISDHEEARAWFSEVTGQRPQSIRPCPAALQLRYILNKFVYPNGKPRRMSLARRAVLSGRRFMKSPELVLEAAIRHGYLLEDMNRDRIERATGDPYSEMVGFATDMRVSPGLLAVLSEVCDAEECAHVPRI